MTRCDHTVMAQGHIGWEVQRDWFREHGYRIERCQGCRRFAVVVAEDGRRVDSFTAELRRLSMLLRVSA